MVGPPAAANDMTLSIDIDERVKARLDEEARRRGIGPADYARQLIEQSLPPGNGDEPNRATLELLARWDREDQTDDPAELERLDLQAARRRVDDLLDGLNPRYAQAIRLRVLEEQPREVVAATLGVSVATFDVVLHRAMTALKRALASDSGADES